MESRDWRYPLVKARRRLAHEDGQALIEYALLLALVAVVSIGILAALGADTKNLLSQTGNRMSAVSNP